MRYKLLPQLLSPSYPNPFVRSYGHSYLSALSSLFILTSPLDTPYSFLHTSLQLENQIWNPPLFIWSTPPPFQLIPPFPRFPTAAASTADHLTDQPTGQSTDSMPAPKHPFPAALTRNQTTYRSGRNGMLSLFRLSSLLLYLSSTLLFDLSSIGDHFSSSSECCTFAI